MPVADDRFRPGVPVRGPGQGCVGWGALLAELVEGALEAGGDGGGVAALDAVAREEVDEFAGGQRPGGQEVERAAVLATGAGVGDEGGVDPADVEQVLAPADPGTVLYGDDHLRRMLRAGLAENPGVVERLAPRTRCVPVGAVPSNPAQYAEADEAVGCLQSALARITAG